MAEPTSATATAVATILAGSVTVPVLQAAAVVAPQIVVLGIPLGLRADVLLAGFSGSLVAMALLGSVPSTGDTWRELVRTTLRRMGVALASSLTAGYLAPLMLLTERLTLAGVAIQVPAEILGGVAFVAGAGAQYWLRRFVHRGEAQFEALAKRMEGSDAT